jgi:hypothetical protein
MDPNPSGMVVLNATERRSPGLRLFVSLCRGGDAAVRLFRPSCRVGGDGRPLWPYAPSSAGPLLAWIRRPQEEWLKHARTSGQFPSSVPRSVEIAASMGLEELGKLFARRLFWMWGCGLLRERLVGRAMERARGRFLAEHADLDEYGYGALAFSELGKRAGGICG